MKDVGKAPPGPASGTQSAERVPTRQAPVTITGVAAMTGAFVFCAVALVALVQHAAAPRIARAEAALVQRRLLEVLPPGPFDAPRDDDLLTETGGAPDGDAPLPIHRSRRDGRVVAVVLSAVAPDGYGGDIDLLVGVDDASRISGVRVVEHHETPGLGDDIERDRSDWILGFDGLAADDPSAGDWATRPRGGTFDAFTGATITPEAVVRAVHAALVWLESHRAEVFAEPERPR